MIVSISLSSGFSFQDIAINRTPACIQFQSRYRAASHFRFACHYASVVAFQVSISLSSGFSFQDPRHGNGTAGGCQFQSRYRAASHFRRAGGRITRDSQTVSISLSSGFSFQASHRCSAKHLPHGFNLVIERLLISGFSVPTNTNIATYAFQSRYRAASHFRLIAQCAGADLSDGFNLVIERLLISGKRNH